MTNVTTVTNVITIFSNLSNK